MDELRRSPTLPKDMAIAPTLGPIRSGRAVQLRTALLVNPFYAKDPRASFGKHVLTPTLALTSIAGATPPHWDVRYWDENLLQGPPPIDPLPHVVGISVHLTFARRAYELAAWYRAHGSIVILGGLHVLSCPEEALEHADAIAIGDGVQLWPSILTDIEHGTLAATIHRGLLASLCARSAAPPRDSAARVVPDDDQRDRDARLSQPLRLLLPVDGRPAHAVSDARGAAGRR